MKKISKFYNFDLIYLVNFINTNLIIKNFLLTQLVNKYYNSLIILLSLFINKKKILLFILNFYIF